ncbi:MAG: RNA polymerase sigma factor RpoE [Betaproteobacteria bacterium TMED156]|nr:MAG: RNA polymerase sigma factor RpoE [Betaproteobacteria bacterium TMED156]
MEKSETDIELVNRVKSGDKAAFDFLVIKYQRRVIRLISRIVRDPVEVEDIAQESFLKAYRAIPQFRGDSAFYTWLYRIAVNTAKNFLFSKGRRPIPVSDLSSNSEDGESFDFQGVTDSSETPEGTLVGMQIAEAVNRAVEKLPSELNTAVTLREMEGLSYEEIAEVMNCPIGTVRSRIFRAREAISEELKPLLDNSSSKRW